MTQRILLVNPIGASKRSLTRKGAKAMKKRKSKRAPIRRRKSTTVTVRANPVKRRRIKRRNPVAAVTHHRKHRRRRRNPVALGGIRRRVRARAAGMGSVVNQMVMPAVTAASGALLLDIAWSNLPLSPAVKVGNMQFIAKALGSVALVAVAHKVTGNKRQAEAMGIGALTVLVHDAARNVLKRSVPGLHLGEYVGDGGSLDYNNPLNFYYTAPQASNTVPDFPPAQLAAPAAPAMHGMGEYVHGYDMAGYDEDDFDA